MRYLWSQATEILQLYQGDLPLAHVLTKHFKSHPLLGSRDRRLLSALLYGWYRCGKGLSTNQRATPESNLSLLQAALFLTHDFPAAGRLLPEAWRPYLHATNGQKVALLQSFGISFDPELIFPYDLPFSEDITAAAWRAGLLTQPRLFLRIRHSHQKIEAKLREMEIPFDWLQENCLALPNGTAIDKILPANCYVVQDASSQQTGQFLHAPTGTKWWDCCAGAGGKSLMLTDKLPTLDLTASDVRPSILNNLKKRFQQYGLPVPQLLTINAADNKSIAQHLQNQQFDGIICDAPCSGSGTWARTPEQAYFFKPDQITPYTERQVSILSHMPARLRPGGRLVYITCSVFAQENEKVVAAVVAKSPLRLLESRLLNGLEAAADSLYVAVLERSAT